MAETEIKSNFKKLLPLAVAGSAVAAAASGVDLPPWAIDMLKQWGPAGILLLGVVYYVPRNTVPTFVKAQEDQAVAMASIADALNTLPQKDHMKFEEILISQQMLLNGLERVHGRLDTIEEKLDG